MEHRVPTVRTTPTRRDFLRSLLKAWPEATKAGAAVIGAQFDVETARGLHCYGHNVGNRKDRDGDGFNYHTLKGVWEVVNGEKVFLAVDDPGSRFCTFASLDEGVREHITFIRRKGFRYESAWPFVERGDYEGYAREIGRKGYYTATPDSYVEHGLPFFREWLRDPAFEIAKASLTPAPYAVDTATVTAPSGLNLREKPDVGSAKITQMGRSAVVQIIREGAKWHEVLFNGMRGFAAAQWLARTGAPLTVHDDGLVEVTCNGEKWLVYPFHIQPISIGRAIDLAKRMGFELPTPDLVDAIWQAADLKIDGWEIVRAAGGDARLSKLSDPETYAAVARRTGELVGNRGLGKDYFLVASTAKDISIDLVTGRPGLYGFHDANGVPIQGRDPRTGGISVVHGLDYEDFAGGFRPVKRAA